MTRLVSHFIPLIAAVALLAPVRSAFAVNTCGGEVHINNCGVATNPFPCCTAYDGAQSNCTWWAWEEFCRRQGVDLDARGNAQYWDNQVVAQPEVNVTSTPKAGAVGVCNNNRYCATIYGHVAYVTYWDGTYSAGSVDVTEGSCGSPGVWGKVATTNRYVPGDFNDGYIVKAVGGTTCGPTPFTDICSSPFKGDIEWAYQQGITNGCGASLYCPTAYVKRDQLATFLARRYGYPATTTNYFWDDDGNAHEADINKIAKAGITNGCGAGKYCPSNNLTRGEIAAFLARAERLSAGATINYFSDDNGHPFEAQINMCAYAGIFNGCGAGKACPDSYVTREQMAAFLRRTTP